MKIGGTQGDAVKALKQPPWLENAEGKMRRADIDLARRVTSYVDPFPPDYIRKVIAPDYRPDLSVLIDDYLADNPTRNRMLDMLPLFLFLDEERVRKVTDDPLVKARPTFHYRLPDCEIHKPDWACISPGTTGWRWNDWPRTRHV